MAKALKCDRCGQFYGLLEGSRNYQIRDMNEVRYDKQVDLCPDCYEVFTRWLTGEKLQLDPISDLADNRLCNTCEFKHLESECLGCAEYDEYDYDICNGTFDYED